MSKLPLTLFFWYLLVLLFAPSNLLAVQEEDKKHILVLNSYSHGYTWTDNEVKGIQQVFKDHEDVVLHIEYMDTKVLNDAQHYQMLAAIYARKYKDSNFDVLITTDDDALKFIRRFGQSMFPGVPLVREQLLQPVQYPYSQ